MNASLGPCRILLCEDSPAYAAALTHFLEQDPELRVVAHCLTGEQASEDLPGVDPDLVIMDVELPGIDGVEATRRILSARRVPVLVLSARTRRGSKLALAALEAGATDVRSKEDVTLKYATGARAVAFRRYVKRLAGPAIARRRGAVNPAAAERERSVSVIGLAAAAGGATALKTVLGSLTADFAVPIVVAQHVAHGFADALIEWLDRQVALPVRQASHAAALGPGAWISPDEAHLLVDEGLVTRLDTDTVAGYHRPAADLLFVSIAAAAGPAGVAVALTGMGDHSADGIAAVRQCGGLTIAGNGTLDDTPHAAAEVGAEQVLPLTDIGPTLSRLSPAIP